MRSNPGLGTNGIIADAKEGRIPTSASTGQRGAHDGALAKKEARYKRQNVIRKKVRRKLSERQLLDWVCTLLLIYLYFFFLHIHSCTLHSTKYVKTQQLPEGSTMAASAPHLSKGRGKHER